MQRFHGHEDLGESVDLLPWDPPHNIRSQPYLQNSDINVFNVKGMESFCNSAECILNRGGHGHIFCSAVRFAS